MGVVNYVGVAMAVQVCFCFLQPCTVSIGNLSEFEALTIFVSRHENVKV